MFGHHQAKRESKRQKKEMESFNQQKQDWEKNAPEREKEAADFQNQQIAEKTAKSAEERKAAKEAGAAEAEAFFSKDIQGLDPAKRKAMQYEANKGIQRSHQSANRKLLGEQSMKGIQGKGGVGYEQQRDLQRLAQEAEGGVVRDLDKLNSDLALKKLAAMYAGGQGEAAQSQLDKQLAIDELQLADEKKRQKSFEDQFNKLFNRV